jgi:hypothetical protein
MTHTGNLFYVLSQNHVNSLLEKFSGGEPVQLDLDLIGTGYCRSAPHSFRKFRSDEPVLAVVTDGTGSAISRSDWNRFQESAT